MKKAIKIFCISFPPQIFYNTEDMSNYRAVINELRLLAYYFWKVSFGLSRWINDYHY